MKSSLILILLLLLYSSENDDLIKLLQKYTKLNIEHSEAYNRKEFQRQRAIDDEIEILHEQEFLPALKEIENQFCNKKDLKLLVAYVEMLEAIGHSASEAPRWSFGKMYTCHPDLVLDAIEKSNNKTQVISDLEFGFENVILHIDTTELNIKDLRKKIKQIE